MTHSRRENIFVTPTAMRNFRERMAGAGELSDNEIINIIQRGCATGTLSEGQRQDGTPTAYVQAQTEHGNRVYDYRAVLVPAEEPDGWPVVITILSRAREGARGIRPRSKHAAAHGSEAINDQP